MFKKKFSSLIILSACLIYSCSKSTGHELPPPNILWITVEDISPYLGCYGDPNAITPNLDRLASEGVIYTNAFANAPVCAPARSTIITGMYPPALGTQHMRSTNDIPEFIRLYPGYLRDAGYYCSNNNKKDYNLVEKAEEWNESSNKAHWRNRKPGQPFFAIFNIGVCHESCIHQTDPNLVHDPSKMVLPPYHPDLPEIRHDWAQFYDRITRMDTLAGKLLEELDKSGLADSTIVIFYGDHGGILGRSKRFMYETGLRVPLIVRVPEAYKHLMPGPGGSSVDRMVSFIDLAPTLMNIAGIPIPDYMQGRPFMGPDMPAGSPYVYTFRDRMDERYDFCRGTFSQNFHYILNYMPHRIYAQHIDYLWKAPSMRVWEKAYMAGECSEAQSRFFRPKPCEELYDRHADPWEVRNLAADPAYGEILKKLRQATLDWQLSIRDSGFIPEGLMRRISKDRTIYSYVQSEEYPIEKIQELAFIAIQGDPENIPALKSVFEHPDPVMRYWAAMGAVILGDKAFDLIPSLETALRDEVPEVRIVAAEALYGLGKAGPALATLEDVLQNKTPETVLMTINILQSLGYKALAALKVDLLKVRETNKNDYVQRAVDYALETVDQTANCSSLRLR
jgi:N-sulfoglucosamine sulfohydrolase